MKRSNRPIIKIFMLISILTLTACHSVEPVKPTTLPSTNSNTNSQTNSANITDSLPISKDSYQSNKQSDSEAPLYFGTWIIKRVIPTNNVTSLDAESINKYLGKMIIINDKEIVTSKGTIINPIYEEIIETNAEFFSDWRVQFSSLGVTDTTITQIVVSNYNHETEDGIGSSFFLTNTNNLYTNIGGVFFELGR